MSMSYYGKMRFDKANAEYRHAQAYKAKVEHYESNRDKNCACDVCFDVVTAKFNYAKQEFDRVKRKRDNPIPTVEKKRHQCSKGTAIANYFDDVRNCYVCRNCDEAI